MSDFPEAAIKKLKVNELKAELSVRGLPIKGKKDELVKRLMEALQQQDQVNEEGDEAVETTEQGEDEEPMEGEDQDSLVGTSQEVDEDQELSNTEQEEGSDDDDEPVSGTTGQLPEEEDVTADSDEADIDIVPETKDEDASEDAEETMATDCEVESNGTEVVAKEDESKSVKESTAVADDFVIVNKPSDKAAGDIEKAAEAQDAVLEEQEVTEGKGETMDVSESVNVGQSPKKSPKKDSEKVSESPKKNRTEKEGKEGEKSSEKSSKSSEKEKEVKKEPEIVDKLDEIEDEECELSDDFEVTDSIVALDPYTSDMNFIITNEGTKGYTLNKNGFSYMWAGARANKGAKGGKIGYELKVVGLIETDLPDTEAPVNAVRIGWSSENSNLQLGESSLSYGFESTGKVCASSSFFEYGEKFGEGDVIGTYLDLESEPKTLRYTKNGTDLGVAMSLTVNLEEKPLYPHVFLRNIKVELNFGQNEEPWFPILEGYSLIQNASADNVICKISKPPAEISDCEVYLMVGLPSAGKSYWVKKFADSHPTKHYNVFGLKYVLDRCKLEGKSRKKSDANNAKLMQAVIKILTKLYHMSSKSKRNYIFDQNNVYQIAQEMKMNLFNGFKRKAVVIVPTHDNLRRRTSDSKRRGESLVEIPFGDLCDMKCEFHIPEVGDVFEEVLYPELDEKNASKTIRDYKTDGSRAKRTGRDEYYPGGKKKRYDDQRSNYSGGRRDNRYSGSREGRRDEGWRNSGSGYGGYEKGGRSGSQSGSSGGYKRMDNKSYNDPYRRNSGSSSGGGGGGGYRQQSYGGNSYGGSGGNYRGGSNYGSYGSTGGYGSSGGSYGGYNSQSSNRGNAGWGGQYGNHQNQGQQWGSGGGNWGNYNYSNSGSNYGGGNYSY